MSWACSPVGLVARQPSHCSRPGRWRGEGRPAPCRSARPHCVSSPEPRQVPCACLPTLPLGLVSRKQVWLGEKKSIAGDKKYSKAVIAEKKPKKFTVALLAGFAALSLKPWWPELLHHHHSLHKKHDSKGCSEVIIDFNVNQVCRRPGYCSLSHVHLIKRFCCSNGLRRKHILTKSGCQPIDGGFVYIISNSNNC